jgi:hypothetical protein
MHALEMYTPIFNQAIAYAFAQKGGYMFHTAPQKCPSFNPTRIC